ncbi:NADP-dependent oxidoreductase [Rhizomonospora bruguierae]|uniref:NADP-dependent oxidoreductase n=1 Tax=Rhizomonospora bruguierae TaxID=1581705 RepID=UPI001BD08E00|nr:NADP-dependent oxidoreductase [Micromonospora sp. NBRC 107566]
MTAVKRIQYHQYGGPEVLRLEEFEPRSLAPNEVLVRVHAASANPMDWKIRDGIMQATTGRAFPRGFGTDFAGIVEAVGTAVARLRVGDEVLGGASPQKAGSFAEAVVVEEDGVVNKPTNLSFVEASALPTVGITAFQAIVREGEAKAGQSVFVHGCLGGVGRAAVQIALSLGASVAGSCRPSATADARALGIHPIVGFDFDPETLAGQFDLILDTAGTLPKAATRMLTKRTGHLIDINPTPAKFARSAMPGPYQVLIAQPLTADLDTIARAAGQGAIQVPIGRTVPLADALSALTELELHRTPRGGKLVAVTE